jgi:hypothetical protein
VRKELADEEGAAFSFVLLAVLKRVSGGSDF